MIALYKDISANHEYDIEYGKIKNIDEFESKQKWLSYKKNEYKKRQKYFKEHNLK